MIRYLVFLELEDVNNIIKIPIFILNDIYSVGFLEENYDFKESQNISI